MPGLDLAPFTGLRFDPARVSAVGSAVSPPYDTIDSGRHGLLERLDPHNVVRLVLPRPGVDGAPADGYRRAGQLLTSWRADGALVPDAAPAIYVYQASDSARHVLQRGLLGALALAGRGEGAVLRHENTMPGPVADRLALRRATGADLEPLLLLYAGGGGLATGTTDAVTRTAPVLDAVDSDGVRHQLWALQDRAVIAAVGRDLAPRRALIADGHHRWAAAEAAAVGLPDDHPARRHLVVLVDRERHAPSVAAIHRVVTGMAAEAALARLPRGWTVATGEAPLRLWWPAGPAAGVGLLPPSGGPVEEPTGDMPSHMPGSMPGRRVALPAAETLWSSLPTALLHEVLLPRWGVTELDVSYWHDAADARAATLTAGVSDASITGMTQAAADKFAVLLAPVGPEVAEEVAALGRLLPRKTTSFSPKPVTGLVLRAFDIEPGYPGTTMPGPAQTGAT